MGTVFAALLVLAAPVPGSAAATSASGATTPNVEAAGVERTSDVEVRDRSGPLPGTDAAVLNNPAIGRPEAVAPSPVFRPWEVGGFVDINYAFNSNLPDNHVYRGTSVQPRTGEFSLNHIV